MTVAGPIADPSPARRLRGWLDGRAIGSLLVAGIAFLVLGLLLPWFRMVEAGSNLVTFQAGVGLIGWLLTVVIAICTFLYLGQRRPNSLAWTLIVLSLVLGFLEFLTVNGHGFPETNEYFSVSFDFGFYAMCLGTALVLAGAIWGLREPGGTAVAGEPGATTAGKRVPLFLIIGVAIGIPLLLFVGYTLIFAIGYSMSCGSSC